MLKLDLNNHGGWKWFSRGNIYVKGYAFNLEHKLLRDEKLVDHFEKVDNESNFKEQLMALNGFFAIIILGDISFVAVDRLRSIPIFYFHTSDEDIYLTDCSAGINTNDFEWDELNQEEFLSAGYVTGSSTLFKDFFQIPSCSYLTIEKKQIAQRTYYQHYSESNLNDSREVLFKTLKSLSVRIFKDVIEIANGKQLVVPLSGGYDSRYILVMLKELGYKNVLCYTYGSEDSHEVKTAKSVAEKLGYKWKLIVYNEEKWEKLFYSDEFKSYFDFSGNWSSNPHFQDFIAIQELLDEKVIDESSIIVPGHSADLLAGKWIPVEVNEKKEKVLLKGTLSELIYLIHYPLKEQNTSCRLELISKIKSQLKKDTFHTIQDFIKTYDQWNIKERQAKFTVNSLRLFDYFELKWVMPLWDNEFTDFWHRISLNHKMDKALYEDFLMKYIFKPHDVDMVRHQNLTEKSTVVRLKKLLPYRVAKLLRNWVHYLRSLNQTDHFNAFDKIYLLLYDRLTSTTGHVVQKTMNLNQVVAEYYLKLLKDSRIK